MYTNNSITTKNSSAILFSYFSASITEGKSVSSASSSEDHIFLLVFKHFMQKNHLNINRNAFLNEPMRSQIWQIVQQTVLQTSWRRILIYHFDFRLFFAKKCVNTKFFRIRILGSKVNSIKKVKKLKYTLGPKLQLQKVSIDYIKIKGQFN